MGLGSGTPTSFYAHHRCPLDLAGGVYNPSLYGLGLKITINYFTVVQTRPCLNKYISVQMPNDGDTLQA